MSKTDHIIGHIVASNVRDQKRQAERRIRRHPDEAESVMDALETAFRLLCTGPDPLSVDCRRLGHRLPKRRVPLVELRDLVLDTATGEAAREAVWRELVTAAQTRGPAWVVGAAGVALPGLRNVARTLVASYTGDPADIDAEVLAGFTQRLKNLDPDAGKLAPRLVWAGERAAAKLRAAEWDHVAHTVPLMRSFEPQDLDHGHEDLLLAEAVRDEALTEDEADLFACTRLDEMRLAEAAEKLGCTYHQVFRLRRQAEDKLLYWLAVERPRKKSEPSRKKPA